MQNCLNGMPFEVMCVVTDDIMVESLDFVDAHNGVTDCGLKRLTFPSPFKAPTCRVVHCRSIGLVLKEKIVIPAASEAELMVDLATPVAKGTWLVAGNASARHGIISWLMQWCP